ncbi:MAG: glycosyltransferase [Proteobacteria bacterium]|nr:glycosyltransferase [Pseudomonadota bacterium]
MPKVTVITSVYNVEKYLERYIESIKAQTFKDFIIYFMNDGTKDHSFDVIKEKIPDDIPYQYIHVNSKEEVFRSNVPEKLEEAMNYGAYSTRKTALQLLETEYFIFIDPDDWVDPDYLNCLITEAERSNADLTKAELCREYDNGKIVKAPRNPAIRTDIQKGFPISRKCCGSQAITILYKTDFVQKNNITFKERRDGFEHDSDDIFLLECLLHQPTIAFCDDTWYHYYQRATSAVHTIDFKRYNSTVKARYIEIELLNNALKQNTLPPKHYAITARRIIWELAKHYRIYIKADGFDKKYYFEECSKIIHLLQFNEYLSPNALGFLNSLLKNDFKKAHFLMTNTGCILLDKLRLLPYGI